jgi:hypothetical protein
MIDEYLIQLETDDEFYDLNPTVICLWGHDLRLLRTRVTYVYHLIDHNTGRHIACAFELTDDYDCRRALCNDTQSFPRGRRSGCLV